MKAKYILILLFALIFVACSIDVSDNPTATTAPVEESATPGTSTEEAEPPTESAETPSEDTPGAADTNSNEEQPPTEAPATLAPPQWAELGLTGDLYYTAFIQEQQNLLRLNLETGQQTTVFDPPENAWLSDSAVSPDGRQVVLAYGPPPVEGQVQFGFTDLYLMPSDGSSAPTPLVERAEASETYFNVSWPLPDYIYYAHFAPNVDDLGSILYISQVERLHIPSGETEVLVPAAAWPRLSSDGTKMAYVTDDNEFTISDPDGSNPSVIELPTTRFPAVDAPLFSPDGESVYFSAVAPEVQPVFSFWDWLMGVKVAVAHNVPSDWWLTPVDGNSQPVQITNIFEIGMYGDFGPSGDYLGFITSTGVQVMNPDGTGIFRLKEIAATGTVSWVP
jgi:Tol biopolymer transport system component